MNELFFIPVSFIFKQGDATHCAKMANHSAHIMMLICPSAYAIVHGAWGGGGGVGKKNRIVSFAHFVKTVFFDHCQFAKLI